MPNPFPGLRRWQLSTGFGPLGTERVGTWLCLKDTRRATLFLDLSVCPPVPHHVPDEYVNSFDILPDGRFVVCSMRTRPEPSDYAVRIHAPGWPQDHTIPAERVVPMPFGPGVGRVICTAGRVMAMGWLIARDGPPASHQAYQLGARGFRPVAGLPPVTEFSAPPFGHQVHGNGRATLASGREVFVWDGTGYELVGNRFVARWPLAAPQAVSWRWSSVPWGDGILFAGEGRIFWARPGEPPQHVCPDVTTAYGVSSGPRGSVLITEVRHPKGHVARLWFPDTGEYLPATRAHMGLAPHDRPGPVHYSEPARHFFSESAHRSWPEGDWLSVPAVRPRGPGYRLGPA